MGRRLTAQVPIRQPEKRTKRYKQKAISRVPFEENLYLGEIRYGRINKTFINQVRRPKVLDPGIPERIFAGMIEGRSLDAVCTEQPDMPFAREVYHEVARDPDGEFAKSYYRARELQQDAMVGDTVALADSATEDNYNSLRLKIQTRQWHASRIAPKKYGDKIEHTGGLQVLQVHVTADEYERISQRIIDSY